MKVSDIATKGKALFTEVKTHWNTPREGRYVPYKEYKDVIISVGCNYAGNKTLEYITFAAGCYLMMYHYKLPYLTFAIINIINMPLNYIWTLIGWVINDNLGFLPKKNRTQILRTLFCAYSHRLIYDCVGLLTAI